MPQLTPPIPLPPRPTSGIAFHLRLAVFAASLALFAVALFLPALHFHTIHNGVLSKPPGVSTTEEDWPGYEALAMSVLAPLVGEFAGLANLFLLVAWFFLFRDQFQKVAIFAGLAAASAMLTLQLFSTDVPLDEGGGGRDERMTHLGPGFYVWLASILLPMLAGFVWFNRRAALPVAAAPGPPPPPRV